MNFNSIRILTFGFILFVLYSSCDANQRKVCREQVDCKNEGQYFHCCATGCCTEVEFKEQSCIFNYNCHKKTVSSSLKYCCRHGCCDEEQYNSDSCTTDADCPRNITEIADDETLCCTSGCCNTYKYNLTICHVHHDCPMKSDSKDKEFCCTGGQCCDLQTFNSLAEYCTRREDCGDAEYDCCDGICCLPHDSVSVSGVIGVLLGIIIFLIVIVLVCNFLIQKKGKKKQGYHGGQQTTTSQAQDPDDGGVQEVEEPLQDKSTV